MYPKSLQEAVDHILLGMDQKDREEIANSEKDKLIFFHHGWGTRIRNELGLWQGNKDLLRELGVTHPDAASMKIIEAVWERLQN